MTRLSLALPPSPRAAARRLRREGRDRPRRGSGRPSRSRSMLDYFPNADHAGIYAAQASGEYERAGLDVKIVAPPDPAAPLKLLQAGRADLAISYEPEVLLARDQGADVVAVGALVQKPLTSLMSIGGRRSPTAKQTRRQARRHRGDPVPVGLPEDDPRQGRRRPGLGQGDQRRLQPHAGDALQEGRRHARRVLELRGRRPAAARQEADDPADGGPRRADLQRARVRRAPRGPRRGRRVAAAPLPAGHRPRAPAARGGPAEGRRRAAGGRRGPGPRPAGRRR